MNQTGQVLDRQKILMMEKKIGLEMETLIPDMQKMADNYELGKVEERSPFRNVLDVATDPASGIEVTKNFIRYQLGRRGANRMWSHTSNGENFAVALVGEIDALQKVSKTIVEKMNKCLQTSLDDSWLQRVHYRLMQLYLGNLVRYQAYLSKDKGKEDV